MDTPVFYIDCMLEDAFAWRSRKLLERIKMEYFQREMKEAL